MSGPYTIVQKAQMAAQIDAILKTNESNDPASGLNDLVLGWMLAAAQQIQILQNQVNILQTQMTKVIAGP